MFGFVPLDTIQEAYQYAKPYVGKYHEVEHPVVWLKVEQMILSEGTPSTWIRVLHDLHLWGDHSWAMKLASRYVRRWKLMPDRSDDQVEATG